MNQSPFDAPASAPINVVSCDTVISIMECTLLALQAAKLSAPAEFIALMASPAGVHIETLVHKCTDTVPALELLNKLQTMVDQQEAKKKEHQKKQAEQN